MRTIRSVVIALVVVGGCFGNPSAATWHIKPDGTGDAATIQDAILYLAQSGDTVLLAPGTYTGVGNRDIGFPRWGIVVTSEAGPEATIIDCQGFGRAFILDAFSAVISGLTMTNGNSAAGLLPGPGGAVYCDNLEGQAPTEISNNVFIQNTATADGGAIYCGQHTVVSIINNTFIENSTTNVGGGIFCYQAATVTISGNILNRNTGGLGGGICCWFGLATISNNTLVGNTATDTGGGICCMLTNSSSLVSYNTITANTAARGGGVAYAGGGTVSYNVICRNQAEIAGGAIECEGGTGPMGNTLISQNTLSENSAPSGGGIFIYGPTSPTIENTIIAFSSEGEGISCGSGTPTIARCNVYGNAGGDALCPTGGSENFSLDPQFCGINGSGNYWLQSDSPCAPSLTPFHQLVGALGVGCGGVSTQEKTWGAVKALYRE